MNELIKKGIKNWRNIELNNLKYYYELLKEEIVRFTYPPSGELRISIPDLIKLSDIVKTKKLEFKDMELIQGVLMDGQDTRYNYHKLIYWFDLLK